MSWLAQGQGQNASATQTVVAIVQTVAAVAQAVLTLATFYFAAILIPRRRHCKDVANLRAALRQEVYMLSELCLLNFDIYVPRGNLARSGTVPPLTIFEANASKVGWLTEKEVTSFIEFSGTLAEIRDLVRDLPRTKEPTEERMKDFDKSKISGMFQSTCQYAATFLRAAGFPKEKGTEYENLVILLEAVRYKQK